MQQYIKLLQDILDNGNDRGDRTGTGTRSVFGRQLRFDLSEGFPLLTTKKVHLKSVLHELLWMISGSTNIKYLQDNNVRIWNEWADEHGELGPVYGKQWRHWEMPVQDAYAEIDQLADVIKRIKTTPECRRLIVSAWNPSDVPDMALPPCHLLYQFYVANGKLSCLMYQRSADVFLGVPFNIASYALLTHMVAQVCELEVGELVHTFGDVHIYNNHFEQVREQITRTPKTLPRLEIDPSVKCIDDFRYEHFSLVDYDPEPPIKAQVSV